MKRFLYILLSLLLAAFTVAFTACQPSLPDNPETLVVEGWIENGSAPIVFVTSSVSTSFDEMDLSDLIDHVAFDANVTITHNGVTYPLTPTIKNEYLLKFCYTSSTLKGVIGGTYQLNVDWNGHHTTATATIQPPATVDSIVIERHHIIDTLYVLKVHPVPAPDVRYYQFFSMDVNQETTYNASYMGTFDSQFNTTGLVEVNRGINNPITQNDYYYVLGDSVLFKIASLEPQAYDFWRKFDENRLFSHAALLPYTTNLATNLTGAQGYFFAYGITTYAVTIK